VNLALCASALPIFPQDVWLYKIACQWVRVGQEQAFVGRCGDVGDDIGSRIITARLARDVMRLCFLVERRYVPSQVVRGGFRAAVVREGDWSTGRRGAKGRRSARPRNGPPWGLSACRRVACATRQSRRAQGKGHDLLRAEPPPRRFTVRIAPPRDFEVINAGELAEVIRKEIHDPEIAALGFSGAIDQFSDSTDLVDCPPLAHAAVRAVSLDCKTCRARLS
jgi:Domain of unknown function (DUF4037)